MALPSAVRGRVRALEISWRCQAQGWAQAPHPGAQGVCVYITAGPIVKLCAGGAGDSVTVKDMCKAFKTAHADGTGELRFCGQKLADMGMPKKIQ
jgi:hypothetical protein